MRSLIAATLVFGLSLTPHAQESAAPALALGDTPGSWVADVATTGGYTGRGNGSISVRSDGAAACVAPLRCDTRAPADTIARLASAIERANGTAWERPASRSTCNDCIVTTLTIRTRQADGAATRTVYSWDNVDGPQLPAPVRAVYDTVMTAVRR
jgi:hypothetical protein